MRRFALLSLLVFGVAAAVSVPLAFASGDAHGGPCTDIQAGGGGKNDGFFLDDPSGPPNGPATFNFSMTLGASACKNVTYTFYVSTDGGRTFTALPGTVDQTDATLVTMPTQTYSSAPSNVCVSATSTKSGGGIADSAPDTGCLTIVLDSGAGGQGFG